MVQLRAAHVRPTVSDLEELRQLMGHKSIITTQRYIHLYGDKWRKAAAKLGKRKREDGAAEAGDVNVRGSDFTT